jgi:uncharacterized protein (DUF3084 family)
LPATRARELKMTEVEAIAEIARLNAETERLHVETERLHAETAKLQAETRRLNSEPAHVHAETGKFEAERQKLLREAYFYPVVAGGGVVLVAIALLKLWEHLP